MDELTAAVFDGAAFRSARDVLGQRLTDGRLVVGPVSVAKLDALFEGMRSQFAPVLDALKAPTGAPAARTEDERRVIAELGPGWWLISPSLSLSYEIVELQRVSRADDSTTAVSRVLRGAQSARNTASPPCGPTGPCAQSDGTFARLCPTGRLSPCCGVVAVRGAGLDGLDMGVGPRDRGSIADGP
jgi:hypothetical protein